MSLNLLLCFLGLWSFGENRSAVSECRRSRRLARRRARSQKKRSPRSYIDGLLLYAVRLYGSICTMRYERNEPDRNTSGTRLQRKFNRRVERSYFPPRPGKGPPQFTIVHRVASVMFEQDRGFLRNYARCIWLNTCNARSWTRSDNDAGQHSFPEYECSANEIGWALYYGTEECIQDILDAGRVHWEIFGEEFLDC